MTIGDESDWRVTEKLGVERQILAVVVESLDVLQIALMLRKDGLAVLDETKGRLELSAHCEKFGRRLEARRQRNGRRREAARAPQEPHPAGHHARDRVVDAIGDFAVMQQRIGCDFAEPCARRAIVDDLRLLGDVAAGHHDRALHARQDQLVQRRRRQHEAERRKTRGDLIRQPLGFVSREQHDRRRRADERPLLFRSDRAIAPDDVEIPRHQRERLRISALQAAQARHGFGIGRVASEVKAAETLDRDDLAFPQKPRDGVDIVEHRMLVES